MDQRAEDAGVDERQIARDDNDVFAAGALERSQESAHRATPWCRIRIGREPEVCESIRAGADHKNLARDTLQDIHLSNDDGAAEDDESALVLAAKAAGSAASQDGGRRRRRAHGWIMTEAHIGRLVAACLHQAIAEQLPQRLEFYEHWLASEELRDGAIGLAPFTAVVGFLRTEGAGYERVVERAGVLAASWSIEALTPLRRRSIGWLPHALRLRAALRAASSIVRSVSRASRTRTRIVGSAAQLEVNASLFCAVRGPSDVPLCGFYAALAVETLRQFNLGATGRLETCRSMGAPVCVILLDVSRKDAVPPAVAA